MSRGEGTNQPLLPQLPAAIHPTCQGPQRRAEGRSTTAPQAAAPRWGGQEAGHMGDAMVQALNKQLQVVAQASAECRAG